MPSRAPRYYWDACVILAFISGEVDRLPDIEAILDSADKGDVEIFTSELSVVEVAFSSQEKVDGQLDEQVEANINELWRPSSPIKRVEFHTLIASTARGVIRTSLAAPGTQVKPNDAVHLATAMHIGVDAIHTYEKEATRARWQALTMIDVLEPIAQQPVLTPQQGSVPGLPPASQ
jgi:predicted nucleic acid-binding protein